MAFVAPHALCDALADAVSVLGPSRCCAVARELTKVATCVLGVWVCEVMCVTCNYASLSFDVRFSGFYAKSLIPLKHTLTQGLGDTYTDTGIRRRIYIDTGIRRDIH